MAAPAGAAGDRAGDLASAAADVVGRAGVGTGQRVLVVVPDRTRPFAVAPAVDALGSALARAGVTPGAVTVAVASGTHASAPADRAPGRLGRWAAATRVLAPRPEDATAAVGRSAAGTDVAVHPALLEADVVLAVGGTAFHYFAGFGGGPKLLFPGLGARASIAANHRRSLAPWPPGGLARGVEPGRLAGNPVAEDLAGIATLLPAATHLTVLGEGRAPAVWATRAEFVAATERWSRGRRTGEGRAFDVVVASAGGHPRDVDVVQSHKALFHAALYARDGAAIVLLAACAEGIGSDPLARWLGVADRAEREGQARAAYDLNAQTAISLAAIAARCAVTWVGDGAPVALDALGVRRERDPRAAVERALARAGPGARAAVLPVASDVVPRASGTA